MKEKKRKTTEKSQKSFFFHVDFCFAESLICINFVSQAGEKNQRFFCCVPNQQRTPTKLLTELQCRNFVDKHRPGITNRSPNVQKRVGNAHLFRLSFHFAQHTVGGWEAEVGKAL